MAPQDKALGCDTRADVVAGEQRRRGWDDQVANGAANIGFGAALSIGAVALPLIALAAGYDPAAVGLLTACSAVSQLGVRLALPACSGATRTGL